MLGCVDVPERGQRCLRAGGIGVGVVLGMHLGMGLGIRIITMGVSVIVAIGRNRVMVPRRAPLASVLAAVVPVLHGIVATSRELASNFRPLGADLAHQAHDSLALLLRDGIVAESRLQVLVVALPTLLRRAGAELLRDFYPAVGAALPHQLPQAVILALEPRAAAVVYRRHHAR